jgi:hypothetical protein
MWEGYYFASSCHGRKIVMPQDFRNLSKYKRPQPLNMTAAFVANYPWWLQAQPLSGKKRRHQKYFLILAIIISHANMQTISGRNYCS